MTDIFAHIIAYAIFACLALAGLGLVILIYQFVYYRQWRNNKVKVYYDDNDHRKGYYIVRRPRGPYPVGYPKERIVRDMAEFERLRRGQNADAQNPPVSKRPTWLQTLLMTPAEYIEYLRRKNEINK